MEKQIFGRESNYVGSESLTRAGGLPLPEKVGYMPVPITYPAIGTENGVSERFGLP